MTKKQHLEELDRRIKWFEDRMGFKIDMGTPDNPSSALRYGHYICLINIRYQVQNNMFIEGYVL